MRASAILGLLSLVAAVPTSLSGADQTDESLVIRGVESDSVAVGARAPADDVASSVLVARALYDQTTSWPATAVDLATISFQVAVNNLNNGRYRFNWYNTDAANSRRKIKLTVNSGSGARLYDIVTAPQTRGSVEIAKATDSFRVIFDEQ
ncbi:hypothetical protein CH063_08113 [Colletotrichum higginsianum]|uniref:Uncharacterized protein n=2 Tax=Colletotrichum higginsianum TaxID=80884 RepID=H1V8M1_COLHI|nr:hypothetical protein CH63R_03923 [Colletotrichum higginsianum IMI 349063]OBR11627.1 hypothetical protein CH63R_03923 [Colletotrichum higginsianum IMI 349063]TIC99341.1 hypothetical protein CH35J_006195 [Colletotrichum higginsianum]GJC93287.1 hypothetical protein ColKHC_02113 [Colletotrichum higginsianum]CCF36574.1 hypothetical protein CH063_08113 [Colletotrichum higginsianum]